jgi:hypothetical protein
MTPFVLFYLGVSLMVVALVWLKGGHPERLGAVFWMVGWMAAVLVNDVRVGDMRVAVAAIDLAGLGAFVWLGLHHERWWPLGVSACLVLVLGVHLSVLLAPGINPGGEASAQLGLGLLITLIQAAGVFERWLAGEPPASAMAVWNRSRSAP